MLKLTKFAAIAAVAAALGACATGYPPVGNNLNSTPANNSRGSTTAGAPAAAVTNTTDKVEGSSAPATGGPTK